MGSTNNKSVQIVYYYVFQKYINKYLSLTYTKCKDNNKIKYGYIVHPDWIKEWKKRIDYNSMKINFLDHLNIDSIAINENQEILINNYIEKNTIHFDENIPFIANNINNRKYNVVDQRILTEKFLENFVNEKTFDQLNINKNVIGEEIKYIFKSKMLILFLERYNTIKILLYSIRIDNYEYKLFNLTFVFKYLNEYLLFRNEFEKRNSDSLLVYLYSIGIFEHPKIEIYNEQLRGSVYQLYQIINENYKDILQMKKIKKKNNNNNYKSNNVNRSQIPFNIENSINSNNINNNIIFNNFRKSNNNSTIENYSNYKNIVKDNINDYDNDNDNEYKNKISQLEKLLSQEQKKNKELMLKINTLESKLKSKNNHEMILNEKIKQLEQKIIKLKNKNDENDLSEVMPGEKILAITFISSTQKINCPIACKNNNTFVRIEEKLYDRYPDLKNYENYFWIKGKKIKRFLTLEENNIKDGDIVMLSHTYSKQRI